VNVRTGKTDITSRKMSCKNVNVSGRAGQRIPPLPPTDWLSD
jgi:hypothetical protein